MTDLFSYEGRDLEAMSFAQNYHTWIRDIFSSYLGESVAEIGAGSGNFSSLLLERPITELLAVEPSQEMYPKLATRLSGESRTRTRQAFFGDIAAEYPSHFDSVVYVNVLEHIEDDVRELAVMRDVLKKGGYACIFVPALPFLYSAFDKELGHFRRYIKRDLQEKLIKADFDIVRISYFDIAGIIPWYVLTKVLDRPVRGGNVTLYDRAVVPIMRRIESLLPIPIGKNVLAIARKR